MSDASSDSKFILMMVGITIAVAVGAAIVYFMFYIFALRRKVPVDETNPFGVLCISIQNADELIAEDAKVAAAAINQLNSVITRNLSRFGAIRSLREGDVDNSEHISIICMEPSDLLDFAVFIQEAAHAFQWGKNAGSTAMAMEEIYHAFDEHHCLPQMSSEMYKTFWGGLRLRMALHFGYGTVATLPGAGAAAPQELGIDQYIYGGGVMKECLFVEEHTFGGQVLVSETFRELLAQDAPQQQISSASSTTAGSGGGGGGKKQMYSFLSSVNAQFDGKVFASQLELPQFTARRHPSNVSAQGLTVADRAKSQKRAAQWKAALIAVESHASTPEESTGGNRNPMQPANSSNNAAAPGHSNGSMPPTSPTMNSTTATNSNSAAVRRSGSVTTPQLMTKNSASGQTFSGTAAGAGKSWGDPASPGKQTQQTPVSAKHRTSVVLYDDV